LTAGKAIEIQQHYRSGLTIEEISPLTGVKADTIKKAVRQGRLLLPSPDFSGGEPTTKSLRNIIDSEQPMGKACVNTLERVLASQGGTPYSPEFKSFVDVSYGGVLLAFLALLRVKTLAQSTFIAAGELGRVIGLDRIPEVKTLRERIALFCRRANIQQWSGKLSKDWMDDYPELAGIFSIDGHVIVCFGHQTKMPKRYVTRLRLCMSGSTDYWVNDMCGQPFFVVNKTINEGMIQTITQDFIPRLFLCYLKEKISDTTQLVNPQYRALESKLKQLVSKVNVRKARFPTMLIGELPEKENNKKKYLEKKAELSNEIQAQEFEIQQTKAVKKEVPRKIKYAQLPENEKFSNAINDRKQFPDTIKMIAYRGETAMVNLIRPTMAHADEARALLQQIYKTDANIYPDHVNKKLIVEIHSLSYRKDDKILLQLCQQLNATETEFPGTDLVLHYKMVSVSNP